MKFILFTILVYAAYSLFLKPFLRLGTRDNFSENTPDDEGEYIDYEEVE